MRLFLNSHMAMTALSSDLGRLMAYEATYFP
jgi:hypothetical protein